MFTSQLAQLPVNGDLASSDPPEGAMAATDKPWPELMYTDDEYGERLIRIRDGVHDTNEYAKFVCALAWNRIDMCNVQNRNNVFNWVQRMENEWGLPPRIWYHFKAWFAANATAFTKKQRNMLLPCLEHVQDEELDEKCDPDKPWFCSGEDCDAPPGPKFNGYLCSKCDHEYACMSRNKLDDWGM